MPKRIPRKEKFLKKKSNIGKKFKLPLRENFRPKRNSVIGSKSEEVVSMLQKTDLNYTDLFSEIHRRIRETDDVLVSFQALDFLEGLGLLTETEADLMEGYVEKIYKNPSLGLQYMEEMLERLSALDEQTFIAQGIVARVRAILEDIQGRMESIVEGGYTANEALAATLGGAGVGASVGTAVGMAVGTGTAAVPSLGMGASAGAAAGGAVGAGGGMVAGGIVGFLLGWAGDMYTENQEKKEEKEKEEKQRASASIAEIFEEEECFPPPIYFESIISRF